MKAIFTFFAVFGTDFFAKQWAEKNLPLHQKREIVKNHLYFWHIKNGGAAYNTFSGKRNALLAFTGALLAAYGVLLARILAGKGEKRLTIPLALILGGGFSNFWERLKKGCVTDFLFLPALGKRAPIFNPADAAIMAGGLGVLLTALRNRGKEA